jgi:hypothetical protein
VQTLGVLDVDGLDVRVQLLLGALLVVTLTGDANTEAVWDTLDAGFPDLLVELGVEADVLGALNIELVKAISTARPCSIPTGSDDRLQTYHGLLSETADLLDSPGGPLLKGYAMDLMNPLY